MSIGLRIIAIAMLSGAFVTGHAQSPASSFDRGHSLQAWQDSGLDDVLARCASAPTPFRIGAPATQDSAAPPDPRVPRPAAIPDVIAPGQEWTVVWSWEGNNVDGLIAGEDGSLIFANNDAGNVMALDPETGLAQIIHSDTNTGGAVSRNSRGELFLVSRGLHSSVQQLEPQRRIITDSFNGEPLECVGGVLNDLVAARNGGVYFTISGSGLYYADVAGEVSKYGTELLGANGVILSPDETTLYVTNGPVLVAFDVMTDGSLANEREFGRLRGGQAGDGAAVDEHGRVFVSTGASVDVFAGSGEFLGTIPGPEGIHGVAFGGPEKRTLFGIVFYGSWGTASARNRIYAIPTLTQGYAGRAK